MDVRLELKIHKPKKGVYMAYHKGGCALVK